MKELRTRKGVEKMRAIEAIPRVAEALRVFPGARVLRVDDADAAEGKYLVQSTFVRNRECWLEAQ